ncbi:MAG: T9SS type A sorting domain-containing protein [Bacteroidales bacterium]|nr:T9SS type A sorting domain-containing protein [Bacteroidales bacterium]
MKAKLLLATIAIFLSYIGFSQCLVLHHEGQQLEPNAEITVEGDASDYETIVFLDVENTCNEDLEVLVKRYDEYLVPGAHSAFCWLVCFDTTVSLSPYPLTIERNTINTSDFSGHYYAWGNEGISVVSYTFFDQNNPNDSVSVTVNFDCTLIGVGENTVLNENAVNIFPVPASNSVTVDLEEMIGNVDIQILDVTGSVVKEVSHLSKGSSIQVSDLSEGLYFYRAIHNGNLIKTGRLAIRR